MITLRWLVLGILKIHATTCDDMGMEYVKLVTGVLPFWKYVKKYDCTSKYIGSTEGVTRKGGK